MNIEEFAKTVPENTQVLLTTKTVVKMNKKDVATKTIPNPFTEAVYKLTTTRVTLNASYEDRVNESRTVEGKDNDFKATVSYGKMVGNALLENNDTLYIKCIEEEKIGKSFYINGQAEVIQYADLAPFMPVKKPSTTQDLDTEVKARNYKVESITGYEVI